MLAQTSNVLKKLTVALHFSPEDGGSKFFRKSACANGLRTQKTNMDVDFIMSFVWNSLLSFFHLLFL